LGLGGKLEQLVDLSAVQRDGVLLVRRFSGGGTVVLDADSIWITLIVRHSNNNNRNNHSTWWPAPFPRPIMEWAARRLYQPCFAWLDRWQQQRQQQQMAKTVTSVHHKRGRPTLVLDTKSCAVENSGRVIRLEVKDDDKQADQDVSTSFLVGICFERK